VIVAGLLVAAVAGLFVAVVAVICLASSVNLLSWVRSDGVVVASAEAVNEMMLRDDV